MVEYSAKFAFWNMFRGKIARHILTNRFACGRIYCCCEVVIYQVSDQVACYGLIFPSHLLIGHPIDLFPLD